MTQELVCLCRSARALLHCRKRGTHCPHEHLLSSWKGKHAVVVKKCRSVLIHSAFRHLDVLLRCFLACAEILLYDTRMLLRGGGEVVDLYNNKASTPPHHRRGNAKPAFYEQR